MGWHYLSVAALAAAVLAPASSNVFVTAQLAAGCTSSSFTTPSWLVENFASHTSSNLTVVSFQALNRATNVSVDLRCSSTNTTAGWQSCAARNRTDTQQPLVAAFQADRSTVWFLFNETWACSDVDSQKPITFTAVGNSSVPLNCTSDQSSTTCRSTKPLLIKAGLLSPVKITPAYVSGPTGHDTPGCTANARNATWEVTASQLNFRTADEKVQGGTAFMIVRNDYLGYTASCGGTLTSGSGASVLTCQGQTAFRRPDRYQIQTALTFDPETFAFTVNQTWYCDDQDPAQPLAITASASTILSLECQAFDSTTTFCTNGADHAPFAGNVTHRALVQPYSLNDPLATADSCTIVSVAAPAWWLSAFETNTTTDNGEQVTARFAMELVTSLGTNTAPTGYAAHIVAHGVAVPFVNRTDTPAAPEDLPWNECVIESVGDPALAPTGCRFRYQMSSRFLGVEVGWRCADLDAGSPINFSGEIRTLTPPITCVTSSIAGTIRCADPDPEPWRVNVTAVTWE